MTARPILFSGPMVRALLAGTKTQTRRVINPQPPPFVQHTADRHAPKHREPYIDAYCGEAKTDANPRGMGLVWCWWTRDDRMGGEIGRCPYGVPGDRLWVRETWRVYERPEDAMDGVLFKADGTFAPIEDGVEAAEAWVVAHDNGRHGERWRPSIFMPRWASRLTLEVTDVRVQRLHEISEEDAKAEGVEPYPAADRGHEYGASFSGLWDSINGRRAPWASNPFVWAITFRRIA